MHDKGQRKPRSGHSSESKRPAQPQAQERLQKVLAAAGIASRRHCEELITDGRVEVDREVVTKLGTCVDPAEQEIRVDGTPLKRKRLVYLIVNKPPGVVSTNRDPAGRTRVIDLVPDQTRLFTVGRLDRSSEGLILVTNDGGLANRLSHPRYEIPKTYRVLVAGTPTRETLDTVRKGVHLSEGLARVTSLRVKGRQGRGTELEMVLTEGRNREIRRVLARVGHKVVQLRRIAIGPIRLSQLAVGEWRELSRDEVQQLQRFARRPGTKTAGTKTAGTKTAGTKTAGKKMGGTKTAGKRTAGTKTGGTKTGGTKTGGKKTRGKKTDGAKTRGAKTGTGRGGRQGEQRSAKSADRSKSAAKSSGTRSAKRKPTGRVLDYTESQSKKTSRKSASSSKAKPGKVGKRTGKTGKRDTRRR